MRLRAPRPVAYVWMVQTHKSRHEFDTEQDARAFANSEARRGSSPPLVWCRALVEMTTP